MIEKVIDWSLRHRLPVLLATVGLAGWLFVPWGYWIDRHRRPA